LKPHSHKISKVAIFALAIVAVVGLTVFISGQGNTPQVMGLPDDWTHHHVVFSDPGTAAEALAAGHFNEWYRVVTDPRFRIHQMKRARAATASLSLAPTPGNVELLPDISDLASLSSARGGPPPKKIKLSKDWQEPLGSYASTAADQYPAKYSFTGSASCSDYVVYPTGVAGGSSQATMIAFTNLYPGTGTGQCGSSAPTVYWAYNTGGGTSNLSPVLSFDGTQVAFVQTVSGTANLVLLKMASSGSSVVSPSLATSASNYHSGCTSPCYFQFSLGTTDTNSSPFYDYAHDTMYVGDDAGILHKYTTVFSGTPTVSGTPWPVTVRSGSILTGPVVDPNSGTIFVADGSGYLHSLSSSGGSLASSSQLSTVGIQDAPLVDAASSTSYVYVENPYGGTTGHPAYVNIFSASSISSYGVTSVALTTTGSTSLKIYDGAFDNQHTSSTNGNYYVCATDVTSGSANATLYQIAISSGPALTLHVYNQVSTTNTSPTCSPVTEFYDGTHDWVFLSVNGNGQSITGCTTGACLYNYAVPANTTTHSGSPTAGLGVTGGSSGIIIDNNSTSPTGASNIYFYSLSSESCNSTTSGCAVQASQASP
jgi:hypothetical protein